MNRKTIIVSAMVLLAISTGCVRMYKWARSGGPGKYLPPRAEIKFTGRQTGLDSLIRLDGDYVNELYITPVKFMPDGGAFIEREYGLYTVKDDTIFVDTYYSWGSLQKYSYKFVVIDSVTVRLVNRYYDDPVDGIEDISPRLKQIYRFMPKVDLEKLGEYNKKCFDEVYKRKWLWEREEDWQHWMDEHENDKKGRW